MPLTKSDYSISEAMEMVSTRLSGEDPLTNLTDALHAGEISAHLICDKTGISYQIPAHAWKSGDGRFVWSPSTSVGHIHERLVARPIGYSAKPTGSWDVDGRFRPNTIKGRVRINRTRLNELLAEAAPQNAGGRKTAARSKAEEIIAAFLKIPINEISPKRGGLAQTTRRLAKQFPDYKPDTIRKIIEPDFRERKNLRNQ